MSGPGKTAPKLHQDFLRFDPRITSSSNNILTDIPKPVGEGPQLAVHPDSCQHEFGTNAAQSLPPPLESPSDGTARSKLAVVCKKCRLHATIRYDYGGCWSPCPNQEWPLHHFQRDEEAELKQRSGSGTLAYAWRCSAPGCRVPLVITYRPPFLSDDERQLLTDPTRLKSRYEAILAEIPGRSEVRQATPVESLTRFRRYIGDSLNPEHSKRTFPANNKRFSEVFGVRGVDCEQLLQRLGFQYDAADDTWTIPNAAPVQDRFAANGSSEREVLECVYLELLVFLTKTAAETGYVNPAAGESWPDASRDIERMFAAQGYQRHTAGRRAPVPAPLLPYFNSLGALHDFADSLTIYAFDRQLECDPQHRAYYFECLQVITEARGTETLQTNVALLASRDLVSRRDLVQAYNTLHIDQRLAYTLSDDRVIDKFHAVLGDLGPRAQDDAKQALYKIGAARGSPRLMNASRQTLETYDDALAWLGNGVDKSTPDESLLAVVAIKAEENSANQEIAQKAISVINQERKSNMLNNWLLTGQVDNAAMGVDEALRLLGIDEQLEKIPDKEFLQLYYLEARNDRPGEMTERAIATVEQALSGAADSSTTSRTSENWPVGLTSHGNTCYLNSLLQYYFSVKPLRDIVLHYDDYRLDTSNLSEKAERVGRRISMVEIKGGQRFADDLRVLFQHMIKDLGPHVKPEADLVCRTFLEPKDYAMLASGNEEEATATDLEHAVEQPIAEAPDQPADVAMGGVPSDHTTPTLNGDDHTTPTLIGDDHDIEMKDSNMPATPPATPGTKPTVPEQAPKLPPRPTATNEALKIAEENARAQQDVTEVHDGVMFRLRSGMTPKGAENDGEQVDDLRQLFTIGMSETSIKDGVDGEKKTLPIDTNIQLNVPEQDTDIYSALDSVFDPQEDDNKKERYKSVESLPPLLQINMPRINHRGGTIFKSLVQMKLEDELFMDRYMDTSHPELLPKRKICWGWRRRLAALKEQQQYLQNSAMPDVQLPEEISAAAEFLTTLDSDDGLSESIGEGETSLPQLLSTDAEQHAAALEEVQAEIADLTTKVDAQFSDMKDKKYRLAAVFFHRGNFGSGHYWIYIHDFAKSIWRKYNDERVDEFTQLNEIFEAREQAHGTPTYAVYVKDDLKTQIIEPVCRDPERPPTPPEELPPALISEAAGQQTLTETVDPRIMKVESKGDWDQQRETLQGVRW